MCWYGWFFFGGSVGWKEWGKGEIDALVVDLEGVGLVLGEIGGVLEGVLDRHAGWRGVVRRYIYRERER